jgi:hypothetical protein
MYKLLKDVITSQVKSVQRFSDRACIPFDPANTDFVEYQKWLTLGNQPLPADSVADEVLK